MDSERNYIFLQKASQYCDYSQEYLSLRARQGKLRAVKLGRNWVTTREWLDDYIQAAKAYNVQIKPKKESRKVDPPVNLPMFAPESDMLEDNRPEEVAAQLAFLRKAQFATAVVLTASLVFGAFFIGHDQFSQVFTSPFMQTYAANVGGIMQEYFQWLGSLW